MNSISKETVCVYRNKLTMMQTLYDVRDSAQLPVVSVFAVGYISVEVFLEKESKSNSTPISSFFRTVENRQFPGVGAKDNAVT